MWVKESRAAMTVYASASTDDFETSGHVIQSENEVIYTPGFSTLAPVGYLAAYGKVRGTPMTMGEHSSMSSYTGNRLDGVTHVEFDETGPEDPIEEDHTDVPGFVWGYSVTKQQAAGRMLGDGIAGLDDDGYWFDPVQVFGSGTHDIGEVSYLGPEYFASGFSITGRWSLVPFPASGVEFYSGALTDPGGPEEADPAHGYIRTINKGQIGVISAGAATGPFSQFPDLPVYGQITANMFVMGSLGSDLGLYPSIADGHVLTFNADLEADYRPYGGVYNETTGARE